MKKLHKFVKKTLRRIPNSSEKYQLIEQLTNALSEKVSDLIEDGMEELEAIEKAQLDFGDGKEVMDEFMADYRTPQRIQRAKNHIYYSLACTVLIIAFLIFLNVYLATVYDLNFIWCVYPSIGILFWPLSIVYKYLNIKTE